MKLSLDTRLQVEKEIESRVFQNEERGYLGVSTIGANCPRSLWYGFRFCSRKEYSARINRLFQRGHREEPIIIADLEQIGVKIHSEQKEVICGYGHIKGHIDGIGENIPDAPKTPHLLEFKTMSEKHFRALSNKGLEKAKPVYYAQMICYMFLLKLKRGLFISVNKNDDARYYERVYANSPRAKEFLSRGQDIIFSEIPPPRVDSYECNWCDHKGVCKEMQPPEQTCRSCQFYNMEDKGEWSCSKKLYDNPSNVPSYKCSQWNLLEALRP